MTVFDMKKKKCPIMVAYTDGSVCGDKTYYEYAKCICGDCAFWEYTKTHDTYTFTPKALCRCGESYDEQNICWNCGTVPTKERASMGTKEFGSKKELPEDDKEGYCKKVGK